MPTNPARSRPRERRLPPPQQRPNPPDGAGEDHGLWHRLAAGGYTLAQPVGIRVRTSARLRGRADGGLAGLLRALHRDGHHANQVTWVGDAVRDGA